MLVNTPIYSKNRYFKEQTSPLFSSEDMMKAASLQPEKVEFYYCSFYYSPFLSCVGWRRVGAPRTSKTQSRLLSLAPQCTKLTSLEVVL